MIIGGDANMPSRSRGNSRTNLALEEQVAAMEIAKTHDGHMGMMGIANTPRFLRLISHPWQQALALPQQWVADGLVRQGISSQPLL